MLTLKPFAAQHYATLSSWFASQMQVVQWGGPGLTYPLDSAQFDVMIRESDGAHAKRRCWMAEDANANPVGHVQVAYDRENGVARLARVAIAPAMRGQHLSVPMLRLVVAQTFADEMIERLELNVYTWNAAAIRTYSKLGFVPEGVRRSSVKVGDERWDTAIMGMLRSEWNAKSTT